VVRDIVAVASDDRRPREPILVTRLVAVLALASGIEHGHGQVAHDGRQYPGGSLQGAQGIKGDGKTQGECEIADDQRIVGLSKRPCHADTIHSRGQQHATLRRCADLLLDGGGHLELHDVLKASAVDHGRVADPTDELGSRRHRIAAASGGDGKDGPADA